MNLTNFCESYEFNEFYHKTKQGFQKAKARDRDKIRWCDLNEIEIVVLSHEGEDDEWKKSIFNR